MVALLEECNLISRSTLITSTTPLTLSSLQLHISSYTRITRAIYIGTVHTKETTTARYIYNWQVWLYMLLEEPQVTSYSGNCKAHFKSPEGAQAHTVMLQSSWQLLKWNPPAYMCMYRGDHVYLCVSLTINGYCVSSSNHLGIPHDFTFRTLQRVMKWNTEWGNLKGVSKTVPLEDNERAKVAYREGDHYYRQPITVVKCVHEWTILVQ